MKKFRVKCRQWGLMLCLLTVAGVRASEASSYAALAEEALMHAVHLHQAGELPGVPSDARPRIQTKGMPGADVAVTYPVSVVLELTLPDNPALATFVLVKDEAASEWRLSDKPVVRDPQLREELLVRVARDQDVRAELIQSGAEHPDEAVLARMGTVDADNLTWLKGVVAEHGLPGPELVGPDGAQAAFLLVQHADLEFQQLMLPQVKEAYERRQLPGGSYALLLDRLLIRTGKPQIYGTQTVWQDHVLVVQPIDDPEHVDERRAKLGLVPLAEYLRGINETYRTKPVP
jgi:hypothetical protein